MKTCNYCGRKSEEKVARCAGCGTEWEPSEIREALGRKTNVPSLKQMVVLLLLGLAAVYLIVALLKSWDFI